MNNYLLFHISPSIKEFPSYLSTCLKQLRRTTNDKIYFITNKEIATDPVYNELATRYNLTTHLFEPPAEASQVHIQKEKPYDLYNFWNTAAIRLFAIRDFMRSTGITDFYHMDNDIMVYGDLSSLNWPTEDGLYITKSQPQDLVFGMSRFKNCLATIEKLCDFTLDALADTNFQTKHGMDMVHEMSIMEVFRREFSQEPIIILPSLPDDPLADQFGCLFDPAAYGQYLGGWWYCNNKPGYINYNHYIGQRIIAKSKMVRPVILVTNKGRVPFVEFWKETPAGYVFTEMPIVNLHVHNKELQKFESE